MPLNTEPGLIVPGQRMAVGTRQPPSQLVAFSPRNGVVPPSGQLMTSAPFIGGVHDDGVLGESKVVQQLEKLPNMPVVFHHAIRRDAEAGLPL